MPPDVEELATEPMTALAEPSESADTGPLEGATAARAALSTEKTEPTAASASGAELARPSEPVLSPASDVSSAGRTEPPRVHPLAETDPAAVDATSSRAAIAARIGSLVDREERAKFAQQLRWMVRIGIPAWLLFAPLDVLIVYLRDAPGWVFVFSRVTPPVLGVICYAYLRRAHEPTLRTLRFIEALIFTSSMVALTATASVLGGWASPRLPVGVLLVMTHGILLGTEWKKSLLPVLLMLLAVPCTLAVASLLSPEIGGQLRSPAIGLDFLVVYGPVFGAGLISLVAGHSTWRLRQQVAEARSIGRYRLRRRIAKGGMGEVWAAFHAGLQRNVAVKLIQTEHASDDVAVERFEREVRMLAELTHPNTIRVFDYGATESGVLYYAMELLDAEDLATVLSREGAFEPERAVRLITQASQALAEAHARGIVHRDVKPANLLLADGGSAGEYIKVIDFGIAKQLDTTGLTQTGMVVGTPGFIAPEAIVGQQAGAQADVYALGMVLYVLLAGELPFPETTPMAIAQASLERDVPPLTRGDLPAPVAEVMMRCLRREPRERFANAGELAHALRDAM